VNMRASGLAHDLLASAELVEASGLDKESGIQMSPLGSIQLKGKQESVSIYGVERKENDE